MSEEQLLELKNQIKQEIMKEIKAGKTKENLWKKIKEEYKDEFKLFNYEKDTKVQGIDYKMYIRKDEVHLEHQVSNAIGTLIKLIYKQKNVLKIEADYKEVSNIVRKIINILKTERKDNNTISAMK